MSGVEITWLERANQHQSEVPHILGLYRISGSTGYPAGYLVSGRYLESGIR